MELLKRPGYLEYHQPLSDTPAATLPFGNLTMELWRTDAGYNIVLTNDAGEKQYAGAFITKSAVFKPTGDVLSDYWFSRCITADGTHIGIVDNLMTPEHKPVVIQRPDGTLYCRKCHCTVPNTANNEMRKEGCFAHSHICGHPAPGEIFDKEMISHDSNPERPSSGARRVASSQI